MDSANESNQVEMVQEGPKEFFGEELVIVNIGILPFFEDLKKLGVRAAHVDWRPPAGGDQELAALLDKLF